MEISLLADHPYEINQIAKWYYNEWASKIPNVTEAMVRTNITEKSINRIDIPLAIIIRDQNELVGVAELKLKENSNYPEYKYWLGGIFVAPSKRGKGLSSLLVSEALNKAFSLGINKLHLQCEIHNVALYEKHGFKILHEARHHEITTMIMVRLAAT